MWRGCAGVMVAALYSGKKVGSSYLGRGGSCSFKHNDGMHFLDFNLAIDDLDCSMPFFHTSVKVWKCKINHYQMKDETY